MTGHLAHTVDACRCCGAPRLTPILDLGTFCVSNFVDSPEPDAERYPLALVLCETTAGGCGLLQLRDTVSSEALYRNYWYRSGMNRSMTQELHGIAAKAETLVQLSPGDAVLDIGCNDGTLLSGYRSPHVRLIGFEPASNLIAEASVGTTKIINDFFGHQAWRSEFGEARAKAITAIAMFYDLDDPNGFVADVARCLDPEGVLVIQMSYLPSMLAQNAFDNICHEHLEYYSLLSLEYLLDRHGLEVFDVILNYVNGGSFRTYIRHKGGGQTIQIDPGSRERVRSLRDHEVKLGLQHREVYQAFVARIEDLRARAANFIRQEVARGKKVYVYGASTKGNTLLQYYGLDSRVITAAAERNPAKWGKRTIGTLIPIVSEEVARAAKPDYFLVLPWHFLDEFTEREADYLRAGGQFIVPLPEFRVIGAADLYARDGRRR